MKGTLRAVVSFLSSSRALSVVDSSSMTHGPIIKKRPAPPPMEMSLIFISFIQGELLFRFDGRGAGDRLLFRLLLSFALRGLSLLREYRLYEAPEERVRGHGRSE